MKHGNASLVALAALLISGSFAWADGLPQAALSLDPTVITADAEEPELTPLMGALDKVGLAKGLVDANVSISGWLEGGYSFNHRHHGGEPPIVPGPFNHEYGNHFMFNQLGMQFERSIADPKVFDVGGLIEVIYGTDAGFLHSSGWGFNGNDPTDDGSPPDAIPDAYRAFYQMDISQAYIDVNVPVGNGLKLRMGKFIGLIGYEYVNPTNNDFYSHSWTFSAAPYSATGILGIYDLSDEWSITAGVTRGWDMTMEDTNGAIDGLGSITYTPTKELSLALAWNVGPEDRADNGHYRLVLDPIVTWQATKQLKLGFEGLYLYDGGANAQVANDFFETTGITHAYGDVWSAVGYVSYAVNDYLTLNGRLEAYHSSAASVGAVGAPFGSSMDIYAITVGTTITPFPNHALGKNLVIRPEVRYDFGGSKAVSPFFVQSGEDYRQFKDQLVFAADIIFKF